MEPAKNQEVKGDNPLKTDRRFMLWYMGWSSMDKRTTLPMLPWLVAEIRRRGERSAVGPAQPREVELTVAPPFIRCVPARSSNISVFIFEHKAQFISRFIHNSQDHTYFAYLIRSQPDDPESEMACHVFKACHPSQVPEVISSIRQVSKAALKEDAKAKWNGEEAFYNSQKFEVLYRGKVTVPHKKVPSTLIDDCIHKFQHKVEQKDVCRTKSQCDSVDSCVQFVVGSDGDGSGEEDTTDDRPAEEGMTGEKDLYGSPNLGGLQEACILEDPGPGAHKQFRVRCNSLKPKKGAAESPIRRRHGSAPSQVQPSDAEKNCTMLFQVGRFEVNLISPDSKTVVLERNFKEISCCSQGIKQTDHFGFVCRDPGEPGPSQYVCYVFQCASESLVSEVMLTLKQAFCTAATLRSTKTPVKLCEACPMHGLHKLCERIEGLYPPRAKLAIQRHLSQLTDKEQSDIFESVQKMKPAADQEENELLIIHLRQLCEAKQKVHLHIGEAPQDGPNGSVSDTAVSGARFTLDALKTKARSSLTSSLENILSRGASRVRGRLGSLGNIGSFDHMEISGNSPPGTPCPTSPSNFEEDTDDPQFRQRSQTLGHLPGKKRISFSEGQPHVKAPLRRQQSVAPELLRCSNTEGQRKTSVGCSSDSSNADIAPVTLRKVSWRQKIFLQVASPTNKPSIDGLADRELLPLSPHATPQDHDSYGRQLPFDLGLSAGGAQHSTSKYRLLWRWAIHQQVLLLHMEKEDKHLEASRDELQVQNMKLSYEEVGHCPEDLLTLWETKLAAPCLAKVRWSREEIQSTVSHGVPKTRRGEVWWLLSQQHRLAHWLPSRQQPPDTSYQDLLKQLTVQQHAILVDLGRTFPAHPYFSAQLGAGQLSLYNLLKAYSLLDAEVGYCQGLSFVAGLLLLHMSEEQAFDLLRFLMYSLGFRRQYRPDMVFLQMQMYQISRLLHDYLRELFSHLQCHKVNPCLYAAPWFLTIFASQFPLGFVARVFDVLFVQGPEVVFKVALCLLQRHERNIIECDSFETIVDYLKSTMPNLTMAQMEQIVSQVMEMDISKQLHAYEVEYQVLLEMSETLPLPEDLDHLDKLEKTNVHLKKQNLDLMAKLQTAHVKAQTLEANVEKFVVQESKMQQIIRTLEHEKAFYQRSVERLRSRLTPGTAADVELIAMSSGSNGQLKARQK
ncbi:TBC1 domain family member 4-like isoform X2 [Brienomyrus brachyistius]|uniref:TBC1 domain family member 4-like isoform X2 n=1 Tax=Brienomyrus brachyistius TaxID=42636 RepID=UPI0020B35465|nr:TBC1 domain family member 4-like isoform X2 [Brienomyrus brachyistius]